MEINERIGPKTFKQHLEYLREALRDSRSSFDGHWAEIGKFVAPRRPRFHERHNESDKGTRKFNSIVNNVATTALRVAVSGMFAGNMSPARPWFALSHPDQSLMENEEVRVWMNAIEQKIFGVFRQSNFYRVAPEVLRDLLAFGTSVMTHYDDQRTTARFFSHPIGTYFLGLDGNLEVNQMVREFVLRVDQIVEKFGYENCSTRIKSSYDSGNYKLEGSIIQAIGPNILLDTDSPFAQGKPWMSVYYEGGIGGTRGPYAAYGGGSSATDDHFLGMEGFFEKPFFAPRWTVEGEDVYATECPGMIALGDIKQLQTQERRKGQAIDKQTNPPLQAPPAIQTQGVNSLPGGVTYLQTGAEQGAGITPLYQVNLNLQDLRADMMEVEQRIKDAFFVPLFLAITEMEGVQPRNQYELINRNDEKLLQLGPVLQQVQGEFLSPVVERIFNQLVRLDEASGGGVLPPPPDAIKGQKLEVKYISSLAQAQRSVATQGIDRTLDFATRAAQIEPDVVKKLNTDWMVEEYSTLTGVSPKAIRADEEVQQMREQEAQQQQQLLEMEMQKEQVEMAQGAASAQKDAKEAERG